MKAKPVPFACFLAVFILLNVSCEETTYKIYTGNSPLYMSYEDLRSAVSTEYDVPLENPGKIYFKDDFIFIIEEQKGIHVIDNSNPSSPSEKIFVNIPGVVDISVVENIMYADSYVDIVMLDLTSIDNIHEVARMKNVLPYPMPSAGNSYPVSTIDKSKGVVTGWEVKRIKERLDENWEPIPIFKDLDYTRMNSGGASTGLNGSGIGTGGSMARFGIKGSTLYILSGYDILIYNIADRTHPQSHGLVSGIWDAETMYLTDKYMFIGSSSGLVIFDISIPLSPVSKNYFTHATACDPVIVDDTLAYITLRTGTLCGGSDNNLSVINIKDINNPKLVKTYSLTHPFGLGKDGDLLFICDGSAGLKIFDASDPRSITDHPVKNYTGIDAYDVIPNDGILILIGETGLYQYDYTDVMNIHLLSSILTN